MIRGQTRNSDKALLGPLTQQWARICNGFPCSCSHSPNGDELVPYIGWEQRCVQVSRCPDVQGSGQWDDLGGLPTPLVVFNAGAYPVPHFCSWHFRSGSWAFWSFYILSTICPNCPYPQLLLVCYSFSVVSLRRLVSRCTWL